MSTEMQTKVQASPVQNFAPVQTGLLQRQCALCNTPGLVEDSERDKEKLTLQRSSADQAGTTTVPPIVSRFGHDFSRVRVHSPEPKVIQTKLKINEPGDPYEQEADRVAEQAMRMPEPGVQREVESEEEEKLQAKPLTGQITPLVQRQPNPTDEEEEDEELIQAKIAGVVTPEVTPAISSGIQLLQGGGRPLSGSERSFFEPRFGADFSNVRVHNGTRATSVARSINARAFTHGHNVVFGAGEYSLDALPGRKLLAHELTHVVQQGKTGPQIQRWAISGNTVTSDSSTDILWDLARDVGTSGNDWPCIVPVSMRTARMSRPPADFNDHYERYVQIGDRFDVSNLRKRRGPALLLHLFTSTRDIGIATQFYPGMTASSGDVDIDISNAAHDGTTPIRSMILFGHATGTRMFGGVGTFDPSTLTPEPHNFALAQTKLLPRRCGFTRNARVRAVGCSSTDFAREFTRAYLRRGSAIRSTTKEVSPCCFGVWDRLAFTSSSVPGSTILDGPFRSTRAFHRGRFWARLRGQL